MNHKSLIMLTALLTIGALWIASSQAQDRGVASGPPVAAPAPNTPPTPPDPNQPPPNVTNPPMNTQPPLPAGPGPNPQPRQPRQPVIMGTPAMNPGAGYAAGPGPVGGQGVGPMDRMVGFLDLVERFRALCADPEASGVMAVASMKDEIRRKPADVIKDYEDMLGKTKSLALRNAIRLALKDLYKAQGEDDKVMETLRAMLAENDAAIQAQQPKTKP